jgi:hypothetical protein
MSMLSWLAQATLKPTRPNPMMENNCPKDKCCGNPACKNNKPEKTEPPARD